MKFLCIDVDHWQRHQTLRFLTHANLQDLLVHYPHVVVARRDDLHEAELWCHDNAGRGAPLMGRMIPVDREWTKLNVATFLFKDDRKASLFKIFYGAEKQP